MPPMTNAPVRPLPSSILHNGVEVRRQYTRAAFRRLGEALRRKLRRVQREVEEAAQDMAQPEGGA